MSKTKFTTFKLAPEQMKLILEAIKDKRHAEAMKGIENDTCKGLIEYFEESGA